MTDLEKELEKQIENDEDHYLLLKKLRDSDKRIFIKKMKEYDIVSFSTPNDLSNIDWSRIEKDTENLMLRVAPVEKKECHCRSYHRRTGEHVEDCPLYEGPEEIETRFEIMDL